jgi:hypothetical protein
MRSCQGKPAEERLRLTEAAMADPEKRQNLFAALNFFEEIALAVNMGLADEEILRRMYRFTVVRGYGSVAPWVKKRRDEAEAPRIWTEVERLYESWKAEG